MADNNRKSAPESAAEPPVVAERPWKFTQWFRKMQNEGNTEGGAEDANFITAVEFDDTGDYLATGDKSGNIVVLQNDPGKAQEKGELVHYGFFSEFQSHQIEFDFVRSLQIEERINQIKWGPKTNESLFLLATNDRQIKLWKVTEREPIQFINWNVAPAQPGAAPGGVRAPVFDLGPTAIQKQIIKELRVPKIVKEPLSTVTTLKKTYATDAHAFNITNMSVSPDKENFLSGDNLKINLWDLFRSDACLNIVDMTPPNMNELKEIITTVDYHPTESNMFLHGSNTGKIRLCDLRTKALADSSSKTFSSFKNDRIQRAAHMSVSIPAAGPPVDGVDPGLNTSGGGQNFVMLDDFQNQQTLFDEVTSGVSAALFSHGGRFIISRDYMSIKIWDMNYEKRPVETIYVHEFLREKLFDLYQSDLLWDSFGLGVSSKGDIVTGTYSNYFHLFDLGQKKDIFIQAAKAPERITDLERHSKKRIVSPQQQIAAGPSKKKTGGGFNFGSFFSTKKKSAKNETKSQLDGYPHQMTFESLDFGKKILDCSWHPDTNAVAIAGQNNLFVYSK